MRKRWPFEEAIKRPYFHVKPLERVQLKNWREYLDFELSSGDHRRVVILFERCVIACALYEDFWQRFATYMEGPGVEKCRHVYERACTIHLPRKPSIHLAWAAFEEQQGGMTDFKGCVFYKAMSLRIMSAISLQSAQPSSLLFVNSKLRLARS